VTICAFRALVYFPKPQPEEDCRKSTTHETIDDKRGVIRRFSEALRFKTITTGKNSYNKDELIRFVSFLKEKFPAFHSSEYVTRELISTYSLLYTVKGSDPSLKPYMLCAHLDVVPVERDKWTVDPFAGLVSEGYIYGRGTIDVKDSLMGMLEALEYMFEKGFQPKRSFFVAFGHDEEGSGFEGASDIAETLQSRGINGDLLYLLDEGTIIVNGSFPGVNGLVAMLGVTEKGYVTVKATAKGNAGHSSMAPPETAITRLAKAITKFTSMAHPTRFGTGAEKGIFEALAPYASLPYRLIYSNLWLFSPIMSFALSMNPMANGLVRTTSAVTVIKGGVKENVIPSEASALINHRIHPADSVAQVLDFDRKLINSEDITLEILEGNSFEPHPISPYDDNAFGYQAIKQSVRQVFDDVVVVPGIMVASTDTKWYLNLTRSIYRFTPVVLRPEEAKLFHGHNERIAVDNYLRIINYYHHLILISDEKELKKPLPAKDEL
jgi:carboxypeptidase PM20D1